MASSSDRLRDVSVLVTGASGFIGAHLAQRLADCGTAVHGILRGSVGTKAATSHCIDLAESGKTFNALAAQVRTDAISHFLSCVVGSLNRSLARPTRRSTAPFALLPTGRWNRLAAPILTALEPCLAGS